MKTVKRFALITVAMITMFIGIHFIHSGLKSIHPGLADIMGGLSILFLGCFLWPSNRNDSNP
jgi:hypothetical protein